MSRLVETLFKNIERELGEKMGSVDDGQYRVVFSGPPRPVLEKVLELVLKKNGFQVGNTSKIISPVLLQTRNCKDPVSLDHSGSCSDAHLVKVRTSNRDGFVVLLPAGSTVNESMGTTLQEVGISLSSDVPVSETDFFKGLLHQVFESFPDSYREVYYGLASELFAQEIVEQDSGSKEGLSQWNLLERLFDYEANSATRHEELFASMGLMYCEVENIADYSDFKSVKRVFEDLADILETEEIRPGFAKLKENADEDLKEALDQCMKHIRSKCKSGSDFKESPTSIYCPIINLSRKEPLPPWWKVLSLDVWRELIDSLPSAPKKELNVTCTNKLFSEGNGIPFVVQAEVSFAIKFINSHEGREVKIYRKSGRVPEELETLRPQDGDQQITWEDLDPPEHVTIEYEFLMTSDRGGEAKSEKIKVISLDTYKVGIVPFCRTSKKVKLFKKKTKPSRKRAKAKVSKLEEFEGTLEVKGMGLHQVDLYTSKDVILAAEMIGFETSSETDHTISKQISKSGENHWVSTIETDEDCFYEFSGGVNGGAERKFRINIEADDDSTIGVESEFDRLVLENQRKVSNERGGTTIQVPYNRISQLERWLLDSEDSYRPLIIGPDYAKEDVWQEPSWNEGAIISRLQLLQDPRPTKEDFDIPEDFLEVRRKLIERIKQEEGSQSKFIEELSLSEYMAKPSEENEESFAFLIEEYLRLYNSWLDNDPSSATWCDLIIACGADPTGGSLKPEPYAVLLSPIHPLRLAWQCQAQSVLAEALASHQPCPAASMLNPKSVPDSLGLPMRNNAGKYDVIPFISVDGNSDYWQVLWNSNAFDELQKPTFEPIFGEWFGLSVDGLASGFTSPQVKKSIDETRRIFSAKSLFKVLLKSGSDGYSSCNDGIEEWVRENLGPDNDDWFDGGGERVDVIDARNESCHPLESNVALMRSLTDGMLNWFVDKDVSRPSDLAIFAHLGISHPRFYQNSGKVLKSATGVHGLTKWRVRWQTGEAGSFIAETRGSERVESEIGLSKSLNDTAFLLEQQCSKIADVFEFAPNLPSLSEAMKRASYCAISSSSLDPACFFGQMDNFYLWDYDLPSYSRRAGENNGYYLLASKSPLMNEAIASVLKQLSNGSDEANDELIESLLVEVANRGMPTLKKLTSGGTAALGEVGMLVALRVLQGDFISGSHTPSIVGARNKEGEDGLLNLIIPADPFMGHFDALRRSMDGKKLERPDLLLLAIKFDAEGDPTFVQITPMEVKARSGSMSPSERKKALSQASDFGGFLKALHAQGRKYRLWDIAWKNLLCSWIDYGFRVYGQLEMFRKDLDWCSCHQKVLSSILQEKTQIAIDDRGRLIIVDSSSQSDVFDDDSDRYNETLVITHSDAHKIITSPEDSLIPNLVNKIQDWETCCVQPLSQKPHTSVESVAKPTSLGDEAGEKDELGEASVKGSGGDVSVVQDTTKNEDEMGGEKIEGGGDQQEDTRVFGNDEDLGVRFSVGKSLGGFVEKEHFFHPSNTALNQLNIGVIGDLGTGKTQLLQALLYNLRSCKEANRGESPNILIFDYKKDYSKPLFIEQTGAKVVKPFEIPLNLFDTKDSESQTPWLTRSNFFFDIISKIFTGVSAMQKERLKQAAKKAYDRAEVNGVGAPTICDVFEKYKEDGGRPDTPWTIMSDLVDQRIFVETHEKAVSFREFFKGVVVIDLASLGQDDSTKNLIVIIFLNLFYENMLKIPKKDFIGQDPQLRALDSFLLVDEAYNIMRYEFELLKSILLQGREFGVGVILASQYLSHFKGKRENYAESLRSWFIHKVPDVSVKALEGLGFSQVNEDVSRRVKELEVHECLYRTQEVEGEFMKGHPFYKLVDNS